MRKTCCLILMIAIIATLFSIAACVGKREKVPGEGTVLWPQIEPFESGYLKVSDIHEIYYELCGNKKGRPVFYLHGGPGGGAFPQVRRYFNPEKFFIVIHDQRGAGRSKPKAEIRENTTQNLVSDIEKLRKHLKLEKILLVGGSWGSTLALAYAETYPENVSGIVLRGVFTATREEIDHFYHGGTGLYFPDLYEKLTASLPDPGRRPIPPYLFQLLQDENPEVKKKYTRVWTEYEGMLAFLKADRQLIEDWIEEDDLYDFALLENYYMSNGCFLGEGQLLAEAGRIMDIPIIIVQGRYDVICPPISAYRLHQRLPRSKLTIVEAAGHSDSVDPLQSVLVNAIREFE